MLAADTYLYDPENSEFGEEPYASISQEIVGLIPLAYYDVSFWFRNTYGDPMIEAFWGSNTLLSDTYEEDELDQIAEWTLKSYTVQALSSEVVLKFGFEHHVSGFWIMDDVSVEPHVAVPEGGATLGLIGLGLMSLAGFRRRS